MLIAGVSPADDGSVETPAPPMIDGSMTGAESAGEDEPTVEPGEALEPEPTAEPGSTVEDEPTAAPAPTMIPIREFTDSSTPIDVTVGEEFSIALDSNPTTGYSWRLAGKLDEGVVQLVGAKFQPPETPLKGAGGTRFYTFRAAGPGETTISLEYVRPWEKKPPVRKESFAVTVR